MSTSSRLSSKDLHKLGLEYVGFHAERQTCSEKLSTRRFRAHYGVDAAAIQAIVRDLETRGKPVNPKSLFMAICWLKLYSTEEEMAGRWGYGEKYCRETVREYVKRIHELKSFKISWAGLDPDCKLLPVDTIHVLSQEFTCDPDSKWWSHKFNGPAVSFKFVCDPVDAKIR